MKSSMKKVAYWAVVAFVAWFLFTQPEQAAAVVLAAFDLLLRAGQAVVDFFEELA